MKNIIILTLLMLFSCSTGRKLENRDSYKVNDIEIIECVGGVSKRMNTKLRNLNICSAAIINGAHVDIDFDFKIDTANFLKRLDIYLPNRTDNNIVIIDVEGDYMHDLRHSTSIKEKKKVMQHYIDIYEFAKAYRPHAQFGFYGFPFREYWSRDETWKKHNDFIVPFLEKTDFIAPSVYDFYEDKYKGDGSNMDSEYVKENILEALRIGQIIGKPVYPFVWHRYHPSNAKLGMTFIPQEEFTNHIRVIAEAELNNKKVDGIIWWSSERYYFNVSEEGLRTRNKNNEFEAFFDDNSYNYLQYIIDGLND